MALSSLAEPAFHHYPIIYSSRRTSKLLMQALPAYPLQLPVQSSPQGFLPLPVRWANSYDNSATNKSADSIPRRNLNKNTSQEDSGFNKVKRSQAHFRLCLPRFTGSSQ
ncbi:uncharacterized protein LOC144761733 [Lissotriton helveticus]